MKIFDKRPLSLILCVMLCSFVIFSYLSLAGRIIAISMLSALFFVSFIPFHKIKLNSAIIKICTIAALISMLASYFYFDKYQKAYLKFDDECTIIGTVINFDTNNTGAVVDIRTDSINGSRFGSYLLRAYLSFDEATNMSDNIKVKITAEISKFVNSNNSFDANSYYLSKGYSGLITNASEITILDKTSPTLEQIFTSYRKSVCRNIIALTDKDNGGLLCAILLGEKDYLSDQLSLDFKRIGISHILALSGMHLAILILGFSKLLALLKINKKVRSIVVIVATILYMALVGFPVSVCRAGLMLIISYLMFLLARSYDSVTSLFISVTIICIVEPYAALSVSLWLSALATFGIIAISDQDILHALKGEKPSRLRAITVSLFAVFSTLLVVNVCFEGTTYLSAFTTILFSPIVELFVYLGILMLLLNRLPIISAATRACGGLISHLAAIISDFEYAYSSNSFIVVRVLSAAFTVFLVIFFIADIKNKKRFIALLFTFYLIINSTALALTVDAKSSERFDYVNCEFSETVVISSHSNVMLLGVGDYDNDAYNDTYCIIEDCALVEIDNYIVTTVTYELPEYINKLLSQILIRELYIPMPRNEAELDICEKIIEITNNFRAEIGFYDFEAVIKNGNFSYTLIKSGALESYEDGELVFTISDSSELHTYANYKALRGDDNNFILTILAESKTAILGKYKSESNYKFAYLMPKISRLIISDEGAILHSDTVEFYRDINLHLTPKRVNLLQK